MKTRSEIIGYALMGLSGVLVLLLLLNQAAIPQDPAYHNFSDSLALLNVPNALNVLSNLPFLIVGIVGVIQSLKPDALNLVARNRSAYVTLFFGTALVALGSGYYHLWPDNQTLVWDRLPMTIAFMALFSIVISEFISATVGKILLLPLLLTGLLSVFYWHYTESYNMGDLRFYAVVQFFPLLAIPIILLFFRSKFSRVSAYWLLLLAYLLAKLVEYFDQPIHALLVVISGHSIKHLLAATGLYILLRSFERREIVEITSE